MSSLKIEQRIIRVIHTGRQGLPGPSSGIGPLASRPAAALAFRGKLYTVEGIEGESDVTYICQKSYSGTYVWRPLITGME